MMSVQPRRIRLKPWLLAQVNSGRYPGLQWLSPDHRLFQIPWRHATRHLPTSEEENTIFKAWALETGKYQEGLDEPDPAKWKANLRCALNKSREFKLKYDGTKETPVQPYKIYEVCDQPCNGDTFDEDEEEMPNIVGLSIDPRICDPPSFQAFPTAHRIDVPFSSPLNDRYGTPHHTPMYPSPNMRSNPNGGITMATDLPQPTMAPPEFSTHVPLVVKLEHGVFVHPGPAGPSNGLGMGGGSMHPPVVTEMPPMVPSAASVAPVAPNPGAAPMEAMSGVQNQEEGQAVPPYKYDLLNSLPLTDLDMKFQYRGRKMGSLTVSNPQGCRLYYGHLEPTPEQVELFGPVTLNQVLFPGSADIQNEKQRFYTEHLLDVMDRGLILEIWEQDIYAIRLCQCKVYWSGPGVDEQGPPNPMERERKYKVFCLNNFLHGLILFQKGETPTPPPFELYFCFGEDWPDQRKPKEKKLIVVQVVPVVARILTEMFSGELSWSTDSIRLQISNPDLKDQTVEQFKELQRLLQSQHGLGPWATNRP
ncbi:interferon regulatory factor 6 [Coregonus clupeaformis]|uniref:interferon regulatory factor 6 n=1 Tax=Coregonus clupeaformis TaxID=59861 RepID=UPI001BDFA5CC|nr:interferon regulatory factor 6 [Coregonus clupeaformis]